MISTIFDEEKEKMRSIINAKQIIENISYKLAHDLNSIAFFNEVVDNIENYSSLERMKKYYFDRNLEEMRDVLHLLYHTLLTNSPIKEKTAEEIVKCCNIFPDNIGKRIIILLSYIPLIDLFYEDLQYHKYFKNYTNLENKMMGETMLEHQHDRLFKESIFSKTFPKDEEFIDYELRNKFVNNLKKKYENVRENEISEALALILAHYKDNNNSEKIKVLIGSTYWDKKKKIRSEQAKEFSKVIDSMLSAFKKED